MKKVNTDPRPIMRAMVLGLAFLVAGAVSGVSQDNVEKADGAKTADTKAAQKKDKDYGVIFGTAYGPDDRPMYGVHVSIRPAGKKHPSWDLYSDHRGEFAQRVPAAAGDYLVTGQAEVLLAEAGKPHASKKRRLRGEAKVHMEGAEWHDFSLHLNQ